MIVYNDLYGGLGLVIVKDNILGQGPILIHPKILLLKARKCYSVFKFYDLKWPRRSLLRSPGPQNVGSTNIFVFNSQVSIWALIPSKWHYKVKRPQKWPQVTLEVKKLFQWLTLIFPPLKMLFYSSFVLSAILTTFWNFFTSTTRTTLIRHWAALALQLKKFTLKGGLIFLEIQAGKSENFSAAAKKIYP